MRVEALGHDALQTEARCHEREGDECEGARPARLAARERDAALPAHLDADPRDQRERGLHRSARDEPAARLWSHPVANAAEEGADVKREKRDECLDIRCGEDELLGAPSPRRRQCKLRPDKISYLFDQV